MVPVNPDPNSCYLTPLPPPFFVHSITRLRDPMFFHITHRRNNPTFVTYHLVVSSYRKHVKFRNFILASRIDTSTRANVSGDVKC